MFDNAKNAKRIISISAAALCMLTSFRIAPYSEISTDAAGDVLTAFEITEDMKIGWNLGNTLDATASTWDAETKTSVVLDTAGLETETAWGQPKATQELFDAIKAKGFNTVRIPTTWFQHLDADNNIDPAWMARVHEVVDYAYKNDMYVILNLHHENWVNRADIGTAYDEMKPKLLKIWSQINEEFKDYDQHLIFECMNEPRAIGTKHEWWGPEQNEVDCINNLNADFVNLIRSSDSPYADTRLLMIPGYCASSDVSIISRIAVPDDDYVAISIHAYSPYGFTMDKSVADHSTFSEKYQDELKTILDGIRTTFIEKDIPVVIGEFGASNFDNTEARMQWADQYISTTKGMGVPCVLWDNDARQNNDASERHDYINRKTLEWYDDSVQVVDKMMEVIADDSIAWGGKKQGEQYDHEDISTGTQLISESYDLDASVTNGNCTPGLNATWAQLDGNDIAIQFTGDAPVIAVTNGEWKNWTEVKPYDIDDEKGIAYYSSKSIANAWSGETSEIEHLFARTNSTTTVTAIAIIGETAGTIEDPPVDNTKKYPIELADVTRNGKMMITFEGEAGTYINGGLGFMGAEDWTNIEWEGTIGADGKLVVTLNTSDIYAGAQSGEIQIWYNADKADMTDWKVYGLGDADPVWGDADRNGTVAMNDVVLVMQSIANNDKYGLSGTDENHITEEGIELANVIDYDQTGLTVQDALQIQKFLLEIVPDLTPIAAPVVG